MPVDFEHTLVACLGDPVAENPTGVMQEAAFRSLSLNWRYLTIRVRSEDLREAITGVRALGLAGVNLTIPHKVAVMQFLDRISPDAALIGAVNTVRREGDLLIGENTDGKGFLRGLQLDAGLDPKGLRVVVLGAGGAARAILAELALAGAADILVVNRSRERGEPMVAELVRKTGSSIRFEPWTGVFEVPSSTQVLVNATSIGLYPDVDAIPRVDFTRAAPTLLLCDAVPNPPETALIRAAGARGLRTLNGLSMLVHQGAIGFRMWTGREAPVGAMQQALREAFASSGF